jgi:non-ribosomal peptide synthetase-like protein
MKTKALPMPHSLCSSDRTIPSPRRPKVGVEPMLLHQFFERSVERWPDRSAVDAPPSHHRPQRRVVSYAELDQQANALAHRLREWVSRECVVAILLPRDSERLYRAQLAVLKAGAAYTCIDPMFPDDQVRFILEDSGAVALLTDESGPTRIAAIPRRSIPILDVSGVDEPSRVGINPPDPAPWLTPNCLAYLIYTSGTTGRPKGVMIEHRSIVNLIQGDLADFAFHPSDRIAQNSSSSYDSSVEEIWLAFSVGASLVVVDDETVRLGPDLIRWMRDERITVLCPPPTLLRATGCEHPERELPDLRFVYVGGEALPTDVAERWSPGRVLMNGYGPTECTVTATRGQVGVGTPITIGLPVPGIYAWVLNESLDEVADGEAGELCLGGIGLARGYLNQPELTAQKFPTHPRLGRIYRTGDLARRGGDGKLHFEGRIDAQVKLRGYRIELEAIEARLDECDGVRAAACRVQGEGAHQKLVAFVVPEDGAKAPSFDGLKSALRRVLPDYMLPSRFAYIEVLPTNASGKLNRKALPTIDLNALDANRRVVKPVSALEQKIESAFRTIFGRRDTVSTQDDFFHDLGGDSLLAARLVSLLRDDGSTASLTVRDVYEARTIAELAKRTRSPEADSVPLAVDPGRPAASSLLAGLVQSIWLLASLMIAAPLSYLVMFDLLPVWMRGMGLVPFLLLSPLLYLAGLAIYTPTMLGVAVLAKKLLIGRYQPMTAPVWGSFYVRNWMVQQAVRLVPWRLLEGSVLHVVALRLLGAKIGERVHIHRGVNLLQGGWDLLEIGDDVTLSQEAALRLVDLHDGQIVVAPIKLGRGATLDIRAAVGGNAALDDGAYLTALSYLPPRMRIPSGEKWDGIPARPAGASPTKAAAPGTAAELSPATYAVALVAARIALQMFLALPFEGLALGFALAFGVDADVTLGWLMNPTMDLTSFLVGAALVTAAIPCRLMMQALAMRLLGRVREGVLRRWSLPYLRVWLKAGIVDSASVWLSGALLWPTWLRFAGMKIGKGCEISTIIDVVPELIEIGPDTFFADGIYLCGPRIHRGFVTLAPVRLGRNTFLGNHAVIHAGQALPDDVLLGISTVADDVKVRQGSSWFGHPAFELPNREIVEADRSLTHEPNWTRYLNRVFWEWLRFALPVVTFLLVVSWLHLLSEAAAAVTTPTLLFVVVPLLQFGAAAALGALVLAMKWALLGRVKPGIHPLWSCWCCRWDFLYVAWGFYAHPALSVLEGTPLLTWYLRLMGMRVGKGVVLGSGFAHVVDPDMLTFEDGATVSCMFQAHTFEDRVLKIDHVVIRRQATVGGAAVLLYGADVGERAQVMPHSVVMKREKLLPGRHYAGSPLRAQSQIG